MNSVTIAIISSQLADVGYPVCVAILGARLDVTRIFDTICVAVSGRGLARIRNQIAITIDFNSGSDITGIRFSVIVAIGRVSDGAFTGIDDEVAVEIETGDVCRNDLEDLATRPVADVDLAVGILPESCDTGDALGARRIQFRTSGRELGDIGSVVPECPAYLASHSRCKHCRR